MNGWRPIRTAPTTGTVYLEGPRGGKMRATWMFGVMGVPGWHTRYKGEWIACGSDFWQPIKESK